jgi:HAD superfamily hydrolase (TIGR01490 family)
MPEEKYVAVARQPVATRQQGEAAFFDVDNTLMRGASLFHVARKMHQRGAFTLPQAAGMAWKQFKFVLRGENIDDVHAVRDSALTLASGITVEDIKVLGEEVYDEMIASRIWPGTKALAQQHLRVGRQVWLVTATPIEVATVISTRLGLTGALGTVGEISEGLYTGRRHPARFGEGGGRPGPRRCRRPRPQALLGVQRLLQRHPAADHGGPPRRHQPGRTAAQARPGAQLAGL